MGIIRRLREWREKVDGTLTGPAIETDSATVNGTTTTDALEAQSITNTIYAANQNGGDNEARLDNALTSASAGETVVLEKSTYTTDRTFSQDLTILGPGNQDRPANTVGDGTTWTLNQATSIKYVPLDANAEIVHSGGFATVQGVSNGTVTVSGNAVKVGQSRNIDVVYESGTSDGLADGLWGGSSVTDNGTNTVGDIA